MIFRISESDAQRQKIDIEFSVAPVIASTFFLQRSNRFFFLKLNTFAFNLKFHVHRVYFDM